MGISIVRYNSQDPSWGVLRAGQVHPLALQVTHHRELLEQWFADRAGFLAAVSPQAVPLGELELLSPLLEDIQLYCQGLNYASHRAESGLDIKAQDEENLLFMKASSSLCGANDDILRPPGCELLDYEIELGLVLRTAISGPVDVSDDNLEQYVGALVLCNDVSARDFMFGAPMLQWFRGKSQRTFCPTGPVLYLLEEGEIAQLYALELKLWMNGELKQHATTDQLIHQPPKTLSEISRFANLAVGDCILTGTPGGVLVGHNLKSALAVLLNFTNDAKRRRKFVAAQMAKTRFLEPGDVLQLEIKSLDGSIDLGTQRNTIKESETRPGY
jgi:2-keto-4-pentenoate hydratase/2-oxohepta-3-ene-1,7-dioic acid hydratase in catechol pathway